MFIAGDLYDEAPRYPKLLADPILQSKIPNARPPEPPCVPVGNLTISVSEWTADFNPMAFNPCR